MIVAEDEAQGTLFKGRCRTLSFPSQMQGRKDEPGRDSKTAKNGVDDC